MSDRLPEMGQMVWLCDDEMIPWIGSRDEAEDGWLWGNSYGAIWHNGQRWDGDSHQDDDYRPKWWMSLPSLPNHKHPERNPA